MSRYHRRFLFTFFCGVLALGLCSAGAKDAEAVKEKLFQAKKDYDGEVQKFKKAVTDLLDKREDEARKAGNKKAVDEIKAERKAFEMSGEHPALCPSALIQQMNVARANLDKAYTTALKEYLKIKEDTAAEAIDKEQQAFQLSSAIAFGRRTYLVTLKHYDVKVIGGWFTIDGTDPVGKHKLSMNGDLVPHSIFMHPAEKSASQVKYQLGGKWSAFRATVGVPKTDENAEQPASELTFELLGDSKSLWKSEAVTKMDTFQTCVVKVEKVKVLTLLVHCADKENWAHTVWFEPILVE
jgi:NPCBM/NEW2 domain